MNEILLSIIVPAYNIEKSIERTLCSIISQLVSETELIIVNDGSTDKTSNIIKKIIANNVGKNINKIDKNNEGLLKTRITGFNIAKGKYIWTVDGGDEIVKDSITFILKNLGSNKDLYIINSIRIPDNSITNYRINQVTCKNMLLGKTPFSIWTRIFKKELFNQHLFNDCNNIVLGEDLCLSFILSENAKTMGYINEILYKYYDEENSMSHGGKFDNSIIYAIEFVRKRAISVGLVDEFNYFAFSQIIVKYLMLSDNKNISKELLLYYKGLNIHENKYIKMKHLCEMYVLIKSKSAFLDRNLTKFARYMIRKLQ